MILDLSEEGMAMQTMAPLEEHSRVPLHISLGEPAVYLETTGYIAWADALGRAGVRFSDLPEEARRRLNEWLAVNAGAPSHMAPKVTVGRAWGWGSSSRQNGNGDRNHMAISLEAETESGNACPVNGDVAGRSATVQYEFSSLGTDQIG